MDSSFFQESTQQSRVKSAIVTNYMAAWANVIGHSAKKHDNKIGYIDLFAGPGLYEDGTKSTPILVLEHAIEDSNMREMLVSIFNDSDPESAQSLKNTINALPGISKLKYTPQINTEIVETKIAESYEQMSMIPCLTFLDPWGYKGLSGRLVKSMIKDWGCECILFFNYNRINMGLGNPMVKEHMEAIFGGADHSHTDTIAKKDRQNPRLMAGREALRSTGPLFPS